MTRSIDYAELLAPGLPPGAAPWKGFPRFNFIGGHNDPDLIPVADLIVAATRVLERQGRDLATYHMTSGPLGLIELRQFLVDKLAKLRGIRTSPENVLITSGSMQAIQLINQILLEPGDTVLVEEFTFAGALNDLRGRGVNLVSVPLDEHGLRPDRLAPLLDDLARRGVRPKYLYTIPTIQNPTGTVLSLERRHELLELAHAYGVPIFEDECYADLVWTGEWPPSLAALEEGNHVLHIGSFSKNLSPALRLGYVVAPWELLSRMVACKADGGTNALTQMMVADFFGRRFAEHVDRLKAGLKHKLDALVMALDREFGTAAEFVPPQGGMFLWVKLPDLVDTATLERPALDAGIAFNPGPAWSADPAAARSHMRLCFALPTAEEIAQGVAALADVCHRQTGVPARSANVARAN